MLQDLKLRPLLKSKAEIWLVTGVAGFIGSNILETLLNLDQVVVGLDNFSTGRRQNLEDVKGCVSEEQWSRFRLCTGDIRELRDCHEAVKGVSFVLHQAALGSVPRSIDDPILSNDNNVSGFLNMLIASRDAGVKSFTYAASSSTYGDHTALPKMEDTIGRPLSPYAVTKLVNELYAEVFSRCYGVNTVGLRYFNVFGPRQDLNGAYPAVIPRWIQAMLRDEPVRILGDGKTSRDFCFVDNAVQANILAATSDNRTNQVFNVAVGEQTSLSELHNSLKSNFTKIVGRETQSELESGDQRRGDVRHSLASIARIQEYLGYEPIVRVADCLFLTMKWFASQDCLSGHRCDSSNGISL